jgi:hypothetical protein
MSQPDRLAGVNKSAPAEALIDAARGCPPTSFITAADGRLPRTIEAAA